MTFVLQRRHVALGGCLPAASHSSRGSFLVSRLLASMVYDDVLEARGVDRVHAAALSPVTRHVQVSSPALGTAQHDSDCDFGYGSDSEKQCGDPDGQASLAFDCPGRNPDAPGVGDLARSYSERLRCDAIGKRKVLKKIPIVYH